MRTSLNFVANTKHLKAIYFTLVFTLGVFSVGADTQIPGDFSLDDQNLTNYFPSSRLLQTDLTWRNLRYRLDYSLSDPMDKDTEFYLKRLLVDPIMVKLRQMIKVNGASSIPKFNSTMCTSEANKFALQAKRH